MASDEIHLHAIEFVTLIDEVKALTPQPLCNCLLTAPAAALGVSGTSAL